MKEILEITDLKEMLNKTRSLYANKIVTRKGIGKLKHLISMDLEEHQDGIYSEKELIKTAKKFLKYCNFFQAAYVYTKVKLI